MSDSNRVQLSYVKETSWGVIPASALTNLRMTNEDFGHNINNDQSKEIRSDRQITDLVQIGADAGGGFNFELSYGAPPDDLIAGALWSAFTGVGTGSTDEITSGASASNLEFELDASGNTITLGSGVTHGIIAGQWIKLSGSTADDGYHLVTAVSGQELTVEAITNTETLDETDAATITGSYIRNGTTESSFTFQRYLSDVTQYFAYRGQVCDEFSMTVSTESIITGNMKFVGGQVAASDLAQSSFGTGSNIAAPTNKVISAAVNVGQIREAGSTIPADLFIQELSFNVKNNVRGVKAIGTLGNADIGVGEFQATGNLNAILNDNSLYDKFLGGTATSLSFKLADGDGNAYIFDFPNVKFETDDGAPAGGSDQDLVENISWRALRHSTYGNSMQICKFAA